MLPKRIRVVGLLAGSLVFYYMGAKQFFVLLIVLCLVTYLFGWLIERYKKNYVYALGICCILFALVYFKYAEFIVDLANRILNYSESETVFQLGEIIAPLGISFMTFQAISYLGDIYYRKINAEKNPIVAALQVCFFPNVTSGPIQKARNFIPQIKVKAVFDYGSVKHGLLLFAFGGLQKYYISDKLAPMITTMQTALIQEEGHAGFHFIFFAFAYAIYIYSNFNSYSDMAIGIAKMLGIRFSENFKRPYLSQSIKEFWQRWHISLNSWFVDYVYIPLGGSRKGKIRYYLNILIVFFLSGLWHGSSLHFIAWGLLNGIYQIVGNLTSGIRKKVYSILKLDVKAPVIVVWKRICVFYLIGISWIFFTVPGTRLAAEMAKSMLFPPIMTLFDGWILSNFESIFSAISLLGTILVFVWIQTKREEMSLVELQDVQWTAYTEAFDIDPDTIKKDDEAAIKAADDALGALPDYEKSLVNEDAKKALDDAKAVLAELKKPDEFIARPAFSVLQWLDFTDHGFRKKFHSSPPL